MRRSNDGGWDRRAFWAVSFLLVITPGADWAYAIAAGLRHRTVLPAVGGLLAGHLAATAVVAAGVAALVARSPLVMTALTVAGAVYLVWLGIGTLAHPSAPQAATERATDSWARQAAKGAGVSGLNPKVFLLFLALLPQFTRPRRGLAYGDADRGAGVVARDQLHSGVHGGGYRGTARAAGPAGGSTGAEPFLRCRNDHDRCGFAGREAARLDMDFVGGSNDVPGRHSVSVSSKETAQYGRGRKASLSRKAKAEGFSTTSGI
jgi:LysE type translocator